MIQSLNKKYNAHVTGIDCDVLDLFRAYHWPGNVRELRNVIERATILASVGAIRLHHLPSPSLDARSTPTLAHMNDRLTFKPGQPLSQAEAAYIKLTLDLVNNNRKRAAEILGISLHAAKPHCRISQRGGGSNERLKIKRVPIPTFW